MKRDRSGASLPFMTSIRCWNLDIRAITGAGCRGGLFSSLRWQTRSHFVRIGQPLNCFSLHCTGCWWGGLLLMIGTTIGHYRIIEKLGGAWRSLRPRSRLGGDNAKMQIAALNAVFSADLEAYQQQIQVFDHLCRRLWRTEVCRRLISRITIALQYPM